MSAIRNLVFRRNPSYVPRKLQRDWVLIPIEEALDTDRDLLVVDGMGKLLYDLCDGQRSAGQIADEVAARFDVRPVTAGRDVGRFLAFLKQNQILLTDESLERSRTTPGERIRELRRLGRLPLSASFEVTGRCNLRCVHCYVANQRSKRELETGRVLCVIDKLCDAGCLMLHITGGECTTRRDFIEIYLHAKQRGLLVTISTNATALAPDLAQVMAEYPPRRLSVSIYGADVETYERVTRTKGAFGLFVSGIELLRSHGISVELKAVLLGENVARLGSMRAFAGQHGCQFRTYTEIVPGIGGELTPLTHQVSANDIQRLAEDVVNPVDSRTNSAESDLEGGLFACNAGNTYFHIDCAGRMHLCLLERTPGYSLIEGDFQEGWAQLEHIRGTALRIPDTCRGCSVMEYCYVCPPTVRLLGRARNDQRTMSRFCQLARMNAGVTRCPVE